MRVFHYTFAAIIFPLLQMSAPQQLQEADQNGSYTLSATSRLVVLDVVVTDKQGKLITDLKKDDFEVLEDKQPQRITGFEAPAVHALPPDVVIHSTEELDRLAPKVPATIIVLDEFSVQWHDMTYARFSIQQYLKHQPKLLLQPTMLVAVNVNRMVVLHDYTQDKDAILATLDHHKPDILTTNGSNTSDWFGEEATAAYRSLRQVAQATAGHPGHKNMIWVGRGLPVFRIARSRERLNPEEVGVSADQARELHVDLEQIINQLIASRVTLYTIDPNGVGLHHDSSNGIASFSEVAVSTGGKPIFNRNDVDTQIDNSVQYGNEFYTLSYIPTTSSDAKGAFRKIRIVMKDSKLLAITRTGYYPNPSTAPPQQVAESKADKPMRHDPQNAIDKTVADTTLVYDGIPLSLTRTNTPDQVMVWMDAEALRGADNGPDQPRATKVQVSCVSFDKKGKVLIHNGRNIEVPGTALGSAHATRVGIPLNQCNPDPRAVRLRVVVQALNSGKIGAANLNLAESITK